MRRSPADNFALIGIGTLMSAQRAETPWLGWQRRENKGSFAPRDTVPHRARKDSA